MFRPSSLKHIVTLTQTNVNLEVQVVTNQLQKHIVQNACWIV